MNDTTTDTGYPPDAIYRWLMEPPDVFRRSLHIQQTSPRGPGGQRANRRRTAVRMTHLPSGEQVSADTFRSGEENRQAALSRLRLALAARCTQPPPAFVLEQIRPWLRDGLHIRRSNPAFPLLIAAIMGYWKSGYTRRQTAAALNVSPSALARFVARHLPAANVPAGEPPHDEEASSAEGGPR